jgi:hypothetical protein
LRTLISRIRPPIRISTLRSRISRNTVRLLFAPFGRPLGLPDWPAGIDVASEACRSPRHSSRPYSAEARVVRVHSAAS